MHQYFAHGLCLRSERLMECCPLPEGGFDAIDITYQPLDSTPDKAEFLLSKKLGKLTLPGIGTFEAHAGREIVVSGACSRFEPFLLGGPLAMLLTQRGRICLKGSSVLVNGKAIGLLGVGATGKSAIAAALGLSGCRVLTDNLCTLEFKEGRPVVSPGTGFQRLWWDTLGLLNLSSPFAEPDQVRRISYPVRGFRTEPVVLDKLVVLAISTTSSGLRARELDWIESVPSIMETTFLPHPSLIQPTFSAVTALSKSLKVLSLSWSRGVALNEIVEKVREFSE